MRFGEPSDAKERGGEGIAADSERRLRMSGLNGSQLKRRSINLALGVDTGRFALSARDRGD